MTFPKVARDLLIRDPSLRRSRLTRSRFARSLKPKIKRVGFYIDGNRYERIDNVAMVRR